MSKEECKQALDRLRVFSLQNLNANLREVTKSNDVMEQLIKEHFELVENHDKYKKALDNAIKQLCINVSGSDACNSLDELYKAFEKKVWEDVE